MEHAQRLTLRVHAISYAAQGVLLFDLRAPHRADLPAFTPGAHIDLHLANDLVRSYSLVNSTQERHRYLIGVKHDANSRGGSAWLHQSARVGHVVEASGPRNNFTLDESAPFSVFVAGGIGITPLWSMVQRLEALERPWVLHYRSASAATAALLDDLQAPHRRANVRLSFSDIGAPRADLAAIVRDAPAGSHFYCCGPAGMLDAFLHACDAIEKARVHFERFRGAERQADGGRFTVRLARRGLSVEVAPGRTILESLERCGVDVAFSCREGVCGACETRVLDGTPDHRDFFLSQAEQAAGKSMMVCCSRALSSELLLDL